MPGPSGQDCSFSLDITPALDGLAHVYLDNGVTRANRASQYNVPIGATKPVYRLTDRLPVWPLSGSLGREPLEQ